VARNYWELRQDVVERPASSWYRSNVKAVEKAAGELLSLLRRPSGTALSWLTILTQQYMGRPLRRGGVAEQESIEQLLEEFEAVCKRCRFKGTPGAKAHAHVRELCWNLAEIWSKFTGKRFPRNLTTADSSKTTVDGRVRSKELVLVSPGPRFVQEMAHRIDQEITVSQITTTLRAPTNRYLQTVVGAKCRAARSKRR
jgi:hypothetical protein